MIEHPFAPYIRILGKGKTGSRSLSYDEAYNAFSLILKDEVEDTQIGAFLMLLRVKEESPEEIAGFVKACRDHIAAPQNIHIDIDWSSYAGKRKQAPWFILSLLLLRQAGYRILVHGAKGHTAGRLYTEDCFAALNLPIAQSWDEASSHLDNTGLCYAPLHFLCPVLQRLINMRGLFGLRSPVHTLSRLLNPLNADHSLQSIFHPAYADTHRLASQLLKQKHMCVFKGESGEIERKSDATCLVKSLSNNELLDEKWPRLQPEKQAIIDHLHPNILIDIWQDKQQDNYATQAITGTLAIGLKLLNGGGMASNNTHAQDLWQQRDKQYLRNL